MEPLDGDGIEQVLRGVGYGFLGLAQEGRPYVLPMSFGYDGTRLFFQMNSAGRKFDYLEAGPSAAMAVLDVDGATGVAASVLVEGELAAVAADEEPHALRVLAANAEFGDDLGVWGVPLQEADLTLLELRPAEVTGRRFGEGAG